MQIIRKNGFDFGFDGKACKDCKGNCCIGESGYIWINEEEIQTISRFLCMENRDFIHTHVIRVNNRFSLKEIEKNNGYECVFFDDRRRRCSIYSVRPEQCRTFPFWDYFKNRKGEAKRECPGIIN